MTLLDQIRILRIPTIFKILLGLTALALVLLNIYIIYRGLQDDRYDFWIAAGASLLAAVTPAIAVIVVLLVTESGMSALKRRMQQMLAVEIPAELRYVLEAPAPALESNRRVSKLMPRPNCAKVECGMYRNELWANYTITGEAADGAPHVMRLRLEMVMRRVNINLLFAPQHAPAMLDAAQGAGAEGLGLAFQQAFKHTISGASGAGYQFNQLPVHRRTIKGEHLAFVASRAMDGEFVWDPSARLEFIQDLVLMLRSFATERPQAFSAEAP